MVETSNKYPASLSVDYPEKLNRLTTLFRIFMVIPIFIILILIIGINTQGNGADSWNWGYVAGGTVFVPLILMILFRQKYPKWWFDWNIALIKFSTRVGVYLALLRDEYPSTDEDQAVHIEIPYPDVKNELKRGLPLVKWFLAIPHIIVLVLLVCVAIVSVIAWFAILFTGRYPKGLFDFVVGVFRWCLRVFAYAFLLTTDRYPPFSLSD